MELKDKDTKTVRGNLHEATLPEPGVAVRSKSITLQEFKYVTQHTLCYCNWLTKSSNHFATVVHKLLCLLRTDLFQVDTHTLRTQSLGNLRHRYWSDIQDMLRPPPPTPVCCNQSNNHHHVTSLTEGSAPQGSTSSGLTPEQAKRVQSIKKWIVVCRMTQASGVRSQIVIRLSWAQTSTGEALSLYCCFYYLGRARTNSCTNTENEMAYVQY